ncbi:MAG: chromate transporter [Oscillospiraceae bacterium]|nr:chromate transporter [Oscillospiraceae bacterium]
MIYLQLFISFLQIGLFSVGGGYAAMPLIQSMAVTHYGWLSMSEFTDLITIAEMTPGPIAINSATFVGIRIAGIPGAIVSTLGCIFPSIFIVSLLAHLYYKYKSGTALQTILSCLRPTVVALIASAGISILNTVIFASDAPQLENFNWLGAGIFAIAFFVLRRFKLNPILVMSCCGVVGLLFNIVTGGLLI